MFLAERSKGSAEPRVEPKLEPKLEPAVDDLLGSSTAVGPSGLVGLHELADRSRQVARAEVSAASDEALCAAAVELEAVRAVVDAAQLHVLGELEARGVCDREVGLGTASWLAERTHANRSAAATRVRLATKLRAGLDAVDAALSDGRITFDHARVLADAANPRIADQVADHQHELVDHAQRAPFAIWRNALAARCELWDQDGGYDPARELARNRLHLDPVGDTVSVSGELVGEAALTATQILERTTDVIWRRFQRDHDEAPELEIPARSTLRALALVELLRLGAGNESGSAPAVDLTLIAEVAPARPTDDERDRELDRDPDRRPVGCDPTTGARAEDGPAGAVPARPVAPPAADPASPRADAAVQSVVIARLRTPDGRSIDLERSRHLLCDPVFHPLLVDHRQVPLALGRSVRLATPAQRRALGVRDGGCVFPGCDRPPGWCDAHHIQPYEAGGQTDLSNLALLCRSHHGVTHRRGWSLHVEPDGTLVWTTPAGRRLVRHDPSRRLVAA